MEKTVPRSKQPQLICLTSGKGGVGKTSLAVNLSFALAIGRRRVLLIDGDLGLANVDVLLGLPVNTTIHTILEHDASPLDAAIYPEPNLGILPASSGVPEMVNLGPDEQAQLGEILTAIAQHFEVVLVDTAAGLGPSVLWFNTWVDHILLVVTPDPTSLTDAYALIKVLSLKHHRRHFHILTNLVKNDREAQQTFRTLHKVADQFLHVPLHHLGAVPNDPAVKKAVREQMPFFNLAPQSPATHAIVQLAESLHGGLLGSAEKAVKATLGPTG
jgi:flagellar biosynthesis protein FlhG